MGFRRWPGLSYGRGEDWHYVGGGGEPAFTNSWANASGEMKLAFRVREAGVVDLHGVVSGGSSSNSIFTLPANYRPDTATLPCFTRRLRTRTATLRSARPAR